VVSPLVRRRPTLARLPRLWLWWRLTNIHRLLVTFLAVGVRWSGARCICTEAEPMMEQIEVTLSLPSTYLHLAPHSNLSFYSPVCPQTLYACAFSSGHAEVADGVCESGGFLGEESVVCLRFPVHTLKQQPLFTVCV
jgi:hypothetical protein